MEAQLRSSAGVERALLSILELSMVEVVLAAGNSLLWILSAVHSLSFDADDLFIVGEMIKGKHVVPRGDSKAEYVPEDKDSDSENDDDEDGEDQEAQDEDGENVSGEEGQGSEGAENEDPEANGEGGSDDDDDDEEDDDDEDEDDDDDDDDDDEDDEEEDDEDVPQPPTKKRK
ncbi:ribosomal L1 domain-containing protein CG13096-like isoform X2 [Dioscorea cayenensis subsp. rotundata]|uniref:Ribosomal L1 domain-containing protein CG13096-like isoform X2 n=1 Tax=Dioscorea cayennensis subsp. rotundata TaxID=55577 RepID=A0AB40AXJ3_DIOCR|nr:ribosomal L1 domain-containing protein CG13096-like isoform X2 [Dioscorea cayenensis subsp. rotundata]